ncbi:MAG: tetratricopeptide repeat protein [Flavobacteriales bacterium]|nr:tetratricopeptide repeat protein [Flavobacteriales bacterium]
MKSILALLIILIAGSLQAQQPAYTEANKHYAEGRYEEAAKAYESLISQDNHAADVYFNLGNAYYKLDDMPSAILNYERALKMKPDHEDALYNLAMANQKTVDKIERLPELFIGSTWRNLVTSRTVNSWAYYSIGVIFLALLFFVGYLLLQQRLLKKVNFYAGLFFFFVSLFCWLMAAQHQSIINESAEAIIFSPSITVQSEPNPTAEKLFTLHAGTKVNLLEENNNWSKIKLPNGNVGWISSASLKAI